MTHVDFIIGFILLISSIFLVVFFVSNTINNNTMEVKELGINEASELMEKYLFNSQGSEGILTEASEVGIALTEINATPHTDEISIAIQSVVQNARVYDSFWNQTISTVVNTNDQTTINFDLGFAPGETKMVRLVYFGEGVVSYVSSGSNITARVLQGNTIDVLTQEDCNELQQIEYDSLVEELDFAHNFRMESSVCTYGPIPPSSRSIYVKSVPVLLEKENGLIVAEIVRLLVW